MKKSVVGLFNEMSHAETVVRELEIAGFARDDISILAANEDDRYRTVGEGRSSADDKASGALKGAGTGAAIGGGLGLIAGLASLAVPGFGTVIAAGPVASALAGAGIGAAAGGMIGALTHVGVPEHDAEYYAEGVRRGGTLVMVRAEEAAVDGAADIMERHEAVDVQERAEAWRQSGWTPGFDASGRTLDADRGMALADTTPLGTANDQAARATTLEAASPRRDDGLDDRLHDAGSRRESTGETWREGRDVAVSDRPIR